MEEEDWVRTARDIGDSQSLKGHKGTYRAHSVILIFFCLLVIVVVVVVLS